MKTIYVKMYNPRDVFPAEAINFESVKKYCIKAYKYKDPLQALDAYAETPCLYSALLEEDADVEAFINKTVNNYLEGKMKEI